MSKHTSGPWMNQGYQDSGYNVGTKQGKDYQKVAWASSQANAQLIAASPELLEACKALLAALNAPYHEMDDDACIEILEAAIAKAEGRT